MAITFYYVYLGYGFLCSWHVNAKIGPFIRSPLKIFSYPGLLLGVSILPGVLSFLPLSALGQNAEVGPTSSATESPPTVSDAVDRPSRDVQVETNPNPVNENFRRFRYNVGLTVREVYDDNINLSSTNRVADWYTVIEPAIHLGFGDSEGGFNYLAFDYILSAYFFADQTERNGIEHLIHLGAQHDFGHVILGISQDVQILDGTNLNTLSNTTGVQANTDVNGSSRSNRYTTTINASYDLTGKLFLTYQGGYSRTDYETETLISSQQVTENIFINYVYSPKLVIGLGGTGGVNSSDGPSSNETFEQLNARATYIVSGKISLSISGGIEFRQFSGGNSISPVYDIAGSYRPFENTTITIAGSRNTRNSASLAGQDFEDTSVNLTLSQRLFSRATFSLAEGYTHSAYLNANTGAAAARTDDYFYIEPAFDINITRYWSVGVYYLYRTDLSTLAFFSFHDNQFGIRSSLVF